MRQGVGAESMTSSGQAALLQAQKRIDDLGARRAPDRALGYTDKHPDIARLQREIKQARADFAAQKVTQPANRDEMLKTDPIYQAKVQERDLARVHLRELQAASGSAQRQIGEYQNRVE